MKRMYITSVFRRENPEDDPRDIGEVTIFDWESKKTLGALDVIGSHEIKGGRSRGATGLDIMDGVLYVTTRGTVFGFDLETHGLVYKIDDLQGLPIGGFHQLRCRDNKIWIADCHSNSVVVFDLDGVLVDKLSMKKWHGAVNHMLPSDKQGFSWDIDKVHLNSLEWHPDTGDLYVTLMTRDLIFNYTKGEVVGKGVGSSPHDIKFLNKDTLLINASSAGNLVELNVKSGKTKTVWGQNVKKNPKSKHNDIGRVRGMDLHPKSNSVFVGSSPLSVHRVELGSYKTTESATVSDRSNECIYDLVLDPRDW
ncbi:MAG: hypothetical protein GF334_03000 [Candidatus Altiarchaeales archaeon]|nr:hypothetical protein [Candidatus Altiarchaeales archaeon]